MVALRGGLRRIPAVAFGRGGAVRRSIQQWGFNEEGNFVWFQG
jgi:hypothetical protein